MRRRALGRKFAWVLASAMVAGSACKKSEKSPPLAALVAAPPPPRPAELLAELCVPRPAELWPALQALLGPPATYLPKAPELVVGTWLSLPPLVAPSLDLQSPFVAAALGGSEPALVFAFHLQSGPEFVAQLTTGNAPSHRLERDRELTLLSSVKAESRSSLGVVDNALLVGPRAALSRAGAYVARALLPKATSRGPVSLVLPGDALQAQAAPALRAFWQERRAGLIAAQRRTEVEQGRPADFADPTALLAAADRLLESLLALLASSERVTGELAVGERRLNVLARLWPKPGGHAAELGRSLPVGAPTHLRALPASTVLALQLWRAPEAQSGELEGALRALFGARLTAVDERALRDGLLALDAGRGRAQALGLLNDFSLVWRGDVADVAVMRKGIAGTLALSTRRPLLEPLTALFGRPALTRSSLRVGDPARSADRAVLRLTPPKGSPRQVEVTSLVEPERFVVTAGGVGAAPLTSALAAERGGASLGENPEFSGLMAEASRVALLAYADLSGLGLGGASASAAPLLVELGARDGVPELVVHASGAALRLLIARELRP